MKFNPPEKGSLKSTLSQTITVKANDIEYLTGIPALGQLCRITGVNCEVYGMEKDTEWVYGYKIGDGQTIMANLPWVLADEIKGTAKAYLKSAEGHDDVDAYVLKFLQSEQGKTEVEKYLVKYLDSKAGAGQINKLSLKFLDTKDAKDKLDIQTNQYIRSSKGTSQINGIISNYLTNGGYDDEDIGDGLIINCN